jgi:hypothetical protein
MTIYERARQREQAVWAAFQVGVKINSLAAAFKGIQFGLYDLFGNLGVDYYEALSLEEIVLLTEEYAVAMEEIDAEDQQVAIDIAAREYVLAIDDAIQKEAIRVKGVQVANETDIMDAKVAALSSNEAYLTTVEAQLTATTAETANRITTLTKHLGMEGTYLSLEEMNNKQAEIRKLQSDLSKLNALENVVKLQIQTNRSAMELATKPEELARVEAMADQYAARVAQAEADEQEFFHRKLMVASSIADMEAEIAGYDARIAQQAIQAENLKADKSQTEASTKRLDVQIAELGEQKTTYESRTIQTQMQVADIDADVAIYASKEVGVASQIAGLHGDTASYKARKAQTESSIIEAQNRIKTINLSATRAGIKADESRAAAAYAVASLSQSQAKKLLIAAESSTILAQAQSNTVRGSSMQTQASAKRLDGDAYVTERVAGLQVDLLNLEAYVTKTEAEKARAQVTGMEIPVERKYAESIRIQRDIYTDKLTRLQQADYLSLLTDIASSYNAFNNRYSAYENAIVAAAISPLDYQMNGHERDEELHDIRIDTDIDRLELEANSVETESNLIDSRSSAKKAYWQKRSSSYKENRDNAINATEIMSTANIQAAYGHVLATTPSGGTTTPSNTPEGSAPSGNTEGIV